MGTAGGFFYWLNDGGSTFGWIPLYAGCTFYRSLTATVSLLSIR